MQRQLVFCAAFYVLFAMPEHRANAQETVATPAIDASIFKDGAVEAREFKFDDWYAKCQQIVKIRKRVCNLLTAVSDGTGRVSGSVLIATTDAGIPAMLISLPRELSQEQSISIESSHIGKVDGKSVKVEFNNTVKPMMCDTSCKHMFPLDPRLVFILNAGESVKVTSLGYILSNNPKSKKRINTKENTYTVSGRGFAETLSAITQKW